MSAFIAIICLLLMNIGKSGGAIRPLVTFSPNWGNILQGDSVTLTCDVPSTVREDPRPYSWYKNNQPIHKDRQSLYISSRVEDSGDYQCRTSTSNISDAVTLNVTDNYVILQRPPTVIYEGDPLTLRCHHQLNGFHGRDVRFYKDNEEIKSQFPDSELRIQKVDPTTAGHYKCTKLISGSYSSYYDEHSDESSISVKELFSPPKIKVTPYWVIKGDEMTVRCDSRPDLLRSGTELLFAFYRDGRIVRGFNVSDAYRVQSAQLKDSGTYTCEVRTRSDTVRKNSNKLLVQIQELFTSPQIRVNQSFPMEEGKWAALECVTVPNGIPSLRYVFYKDSEMIQDADMRRSSYVIVRAREEHTGNYWCSVQTRDGSVRKNSTHAHILVQHPISGVNIIVNKGDMNFVYGKSLTFDCSVEKGTSPSFLWLHNETVVEKDSDLYQLRDNGTVLYIESLQSHHIGSYRCNVSNKLPQTSSNKLNSITNIVWISQISEDPPPGSNIVWPVLGVLAFILLLVIILVFINRSKFPSLISSLSSHQKQQNSESMPDKDNPRDDGRSANEGTNRSNEIDNNEHLYSNVSSGQVEDDVCYTYIDIKQIQASKGKINNKDEPPVVYSVLRPVAKSKMIRATPVTDDSANDMRIYQMPP